MFEYRSASSFYKGAYLYLPLERKHHPIYSEQCNTYGRFTHATYSTEREPRKQRSALAGPKLRCVRKGTRRTLIYIPIKTVSIFSSTFFNTLNGYTDWDEYSNTGDLCRHIVVRGYHGWISLWTRLASVALIPNRGLNLQNPYTESELN